MKKTSKSLHIVTRLRIRQASVAGFFVLWIREVGTYEMHFFVLLVLLFVLLLLVLLLAAAVFWTKQIPGWLRQNISAECQLLGLVKQHTAGGDLKMRQALNGFRV